MKMKRTAMALAINATVVAFRVLKVWLNSSIKLWGSVFRIRKEAFLKILSCDCGETFFQRCAESACFNIHKKGVGV